LAPSQDQLLLDLLAEPSPAVSEVGPQEKISLGSTTSSGFTPTSGFALSSGLVSDTYAPSVSQPTSLTTPMFYAQEIQQTPQAQVQTQAQQLQAQQLQTQQLQAQIQAQQLQNQLQRQQLQAQLQAQQLQAQQLQAQAQLQAQIQAQKLQNQQLQAQQTQAQIQKQQLPAQTVVQPQASQVIAPAAQSQSSSLTTAIPGPVPTVTQAPVQVVSQQFGPGHDIVKASLVSILGDITRSGTPSLLDANVVSAPNDIFNQAYLQDYPSFGSSIYVAIKNFYNNRTASSYGDMQILLKNSQDKAFLTASQNADIKNCLIQVMEDVKAALKSILEDPAKSGTPTLLNANVIDATSTTDSLTINLIQSFNQSYLQNYPSSGFSIYTAIQTFYNKRNLYPLGDLQMLLTNAQNKAFLTASQKSDLKSWGGRLIDEVKSALTTILNDKTKSGNPALLNSNVVAESTGMFNQSYLQDYPNSGNSIYTAIKNFYNNRASFSLTDLKILLNNAMNKSFLSFAQNSDLANWLMQVGIDIDVENRASAIKIAEMTRVNNLLSNFMVTNSTYDSQLLVLQELVKSVAANSGFDYTQCQPVFWMALTNLHNVRPKTDKARLIALKNWYATLATSKLVATGKNFTTMNNDIDSDSKMIDQVAAQTAEMTRVNNILSNFTVTASTYDSQLPILPSLVTSIVANFQANKLLDYTSVQATFWIALTSLHNARPKTDKTKLTILKTWYTTLNTWVATLAASKLVTPDKNFTAMINDINSDLKKIDQAAAQTVEMTRVNNILSNFTVTNSTYDSQLQILPNLASSIVANFQANMSLDYTSVQASFWAALTNLHNARPKTDKTKLMTLKSWYDTLNAWYATLAASKLVTPDKNFTTMINDVVTDISKIQPVQITIIPINKP